MVLKPPVWGDLSSAVPQRTAGYAPTQEGAAVSPSAQNQPAPRNSAPSSQPARPAPSNQQPNAVSNGGMTASQQPQPQQRHQQNSQSQGMAQPAQQRPSQGYPQPNGTPNGGTPAPQQSYPQQQNAQQQNGYQSNAYAQGGHQYPAPASQATPVQPKPVQRQGDSRQRSNGQNRNNSSFVHRKIWTIGGRKKFIDFVDKLSLANVEDFANIHGIGGKDHARNSVIGITICDYSSKGSGGSSLTLNCSLDVEDVDQLYEAAKLARLGKLQPDSRMEIQWMDAVQRQIEGFKRFPPLPDGSRPIPAAALNALVGTITNARKTLEPIVGAPYYTYGPIEKNNPHEAKKRRDGLAPCYRLLITCSPFQKDGTPSAYPWYVRIETFDAPLTTQKNGATNHKSNQATNKKSVFINLSCDDFWRAMVAIKRYVRTWENLRTRRLFAEAEQRLAMQRESWGSENQTQGYR